MEVSEEKKKVEDAQQWDYDPSVLPGAGESGGDEEFDLGVAIRSMSDAQASGTCVDALQCRDRQVTLSRIPWVVFALHCLLFVMLVAWELVDGSKSAAVIIVAIAVTAASAGLQLGWIVVAGRSGITYL